MNFEQLRSFVTVHEMGHFTRAAAHLHLAQPSLSRQISVLENDLGAPLFHRITGNVTLTAAGEALLPLATRMLADADTVRFEMQELAGLRRGRVRLGATPTLCISLVAEVLTSFHSAYPGIELHLTERGSLGLMDGLVNGTLDLALVTTSQDAPTPAPGLKMVPILSEELVVIASTKDAALNDVEALTLAELAELPQITYQENYELRATTMQAFRAAGLVPNIVLEGAEMDAVLRCVERGLGVSVVPAMVMVDRPGLRSVRLRTPRFSRTISLAHRDDMPLTRAAHAMQDLIIHTANILSSSNTATAGLIHTSAAHQILDQADAKTTLRSR